MKVGPKLFVSEKVRLTSEQTEETVLASTSLTGAFQSTFSHSEASCSPSGSVRYDTKLK